MDSVGRAGVFARFLPFALAAAVAALPFVARGEGGRGVVVVGSSTVYPFSAVAAERFAQITGGRAPKIESTGSGGGIKIFCAGQGGGTPDIVNSSRRMKPSEQKLCAENNAGGILEIKIGYDGIVVAQSAEAKPFALTREILFLALARQLPDGEGGMQKNPHQQWSDLDSSLPALPIRVYGPPPSSGTRDAFAELVMEEACAEFPGMREQKKADKKKFRALCGAMREDGAYIDAGENDNLIIRKLLASPDSLGIFGYGFLDASRGKVRGLSIGGVAPEFDAIADGDYPVSRPLYFYAKLAHYSLTPELESFVRFFLSPEVTGEEGFLAERGLIPLPPEEYRAMQNAADERRPMAQL